MANIKSAIKRNKQNNVRRVHNRIFRGKARTAVQKARVEITAAKKPSEASEATMKEAISALDKAAQKGVLHKNNAARRKSRLMKKLAALKK